MAKYCKELVDKICGYLREGETVESTCKLVNIAKSVFYLWKQEKSDFLDAINKAVEEYEATCVEKAEHSLFKRAVGYDYESTETVFVDCDGSPKIKQKKKKITHVAPDVSALQFFLTNRAGDRWKNKQQNELTGTLTNHVTIEYVDSGISPAHSEDEIAD